MVFAIHQNESATGIHVSPPSGSPFHLLPLPLGCCRAPTLGALLLALNFHWSSVLHMVMYLFQCCPLQSSHPCLLPLSPKVCSLHLCLLCLVLWLQSLSAVILEPKKIRSLTVSTFSFSICHTDYLI